MVKILAAPWLKLAQNDEIQIGLDRTDKLLADYHEEAENDVTLGH